MPKAVTRTLGKRVLFPLYAESPPRESEANRRNIPKTRFIMTGSMMVMTLFLGLIGDWVVRVLYLPDYHLAGPILVPVALASTPAMIVAASGGMLLGSSRG